MNFEDLAYVVETGKSFDDASVSVLRAVEQKGWQVFSVIDISERLRSKGFDQPRLKIIEICNGKHANYFLNKNKYISLFMPCRISIIEEDGAVKLGSMRPAIVSQFFDSVEADEAMNVENDIVEIINNAK